MRENLIKELKDLAQEILLLKEEEEVIGLREKAHKVYEKLVVLDYLNKNPKPIVEEIKLPKVKRAKKQVENTLFPNEKRIKKKKEKEPIRLEDLFVPTFDSIKDDMSQKEEFKDTISLDETEKLFNTKKEIPRQLSLNDKLLGDSIQIGLNDRIAFVNKLFNFSQSEFNKVLSNLNEFNNKQEAISYIQYSVKPKYNWKGKEELEERLILIIERKFL